jgi:hypothetical protein
MGIKSRGVAFLRRSYANEIDEIPLLVDYYLLIAILSTDKISYIHHFLFSSLLIGPFSNSFALLKVHF